MPPPISTSLANTARDGNCENDPGQLNVLFELMNRNTPVAHHRGVVFEGQGRAQQGGQVSSLTDARIRTGIRVSDIWACG